MPYIGEFKKNFRLIFKQVFSAISELGIQVFAYRNVIKVAYWKETVGTRTLDAHRQSKQDRNNNYLINHVFFFRPSDNYERKKKRSRATGHGCVYFPIRSQAGNVFPMCT